jgi:hypothetical protein
MRWLIVALAVLLLGAQSVRGQSVNVVVPGTANPFLAGMPDGSGDIYGYDFAPAESPIQVPGLALSAGTFLRFQVTGSVSNGLYPSGWSPDGDLSPGGWGYISHTPNQSPKNGISDYALPMGCLLGVFLTDAQPNTLPGPTELNFDLSNPDCNVPGGIAYVSLSPQLQQTFFIGDGLTGDGSGIQQTIYAPAGATRFFLGASDEYGWAGNYGSFDVTVNSTPEPSTLALLGTAAISLLAYAWRRERCPAARSVPLFFGALLALRSRGDTSPAK